LGALKQDVAEQVWEALRSEDAVPRLVGVVHGWKNDGCTREEAEQRLTAVLAEVATRGTEAEDESLRAVLDFVTGFCGPHARIFPD
jgi:hypothetical protein